MCHINLSMIFLHRAGRECFYIELARNIFAQSLQGMCLHTAGNECFCIELGRNDFAKS